MFTARPAHSNQNEQTQNEKCIFTGNNQAAGYDASATSVLKHHGGVAGDIVLRVTNLNTFSTVRITSMPTPTGTLPLKLAVTQNGKHGEIVLKLNLNSIPVNAGYEGAGSRQKRIKYS
jgi:hypothetical protein